tara:strand:- start:93 stop:470 length:378 start_codon:yes stop_codon:yes gene_type:complete
MKNLIIDTNENSILFKIITKNSYYTNEIINCRENFDQLTSLLFKFLNKNSIELSKSDNVFINCGPGKFAHVRLFVSLGKALSVTKKINLYGFKAGFFREIDYNKIIKTLNKKKLKKNLIKPIYSC